MNLTRFRTYDDYIQAQEQTVLRRGPGPYFTDIEIAAACDWLKVRWPGWQSRTIRGLCHGARSGQEADEFALHFIGSNIIGTDLFPHAGRSRRFAVQSEVVQHDFAVQKPEWVGRFDFVYSNSLDHARYPKKCLKTWLEQLRPDGYLLLQWDDTRSETNGGDCFAASTAEVIGLLRKLGRFVECLHSECPFNRANKLQKRALVVNLLIGRRRKR